MGSQARLEAVKKVGEFQGRYFVRRRGRTNECEEERGEARDGRKRRVSKQEERSEGGMREENDYEE